MGVPTTANYIITSLVMAPAIFQAVRTLSPYSLMVPGFNTAIALLAAHFFVFYFGILADITPPVALASYAGSALAGGDFWKTSINAVRYAVAGYIGPYIYFTHPEMFLITVQHWNISTVLTVMYDLGATLLVMYMLSIAFTGWFGGHLKAVFRLLLGFVALIAATLNVFVVAIGLVLVLVTRLFTSKVAASEPA